MRMTLPSVGWKPARKLSAVFFFLAFAACISWFAHSAFTERRVDIWLERSIRAHPIQYRLVLKSFDPDRKFVEARAEVVFHKSALTAFDEELGLEAEEILFGDVQISYGHLVFEDLSESFSILGLSVLRHFPILEKLVDSLPDGYTTSPPSPVRKQLQVLGSPELYPFDKYLVVARLWCDAYATTSDSKNTYVSEGRHGRFFPHYEVELQFSNLVLRRVSVKDLESWPTVISTFSKDEEPRRQKLGRGNAVFLLERPLFIKFVSIFLAIVAVGSSVFIVFSMDPKQLLFNSMVYFLTLWAVRETLSVGGPETPSIIDYGVMVLYATLLGMILAKLIWGRQRRPNG